MISATLIYYSENLIDKCVFFWQNYLHTEAYWVNKMADILQTSFWNAILSDDNLYICFKLHCNFFPEGPIDPQKQFVPECQLEPKKQTAMKFETKYKHGFR